MRIAWASKGPPPLMMLSGDNRFLRRRAVNHLVNQAFAAGYEVTFAGSDPEIVDTISMATTFGQPALIVADRSAVVLETAKALVEDKPQRVGILIESSSGKGGDDPLADMIHGAHHTTFNLPAKRKDQEAFAVRFLHHESDRLMGKKGSIDKNLAAALVRGVGTDIGMLAYEASKFTALTRSRGGEQVGVEDIRATIRGSAEADMQPIRAALAAADEKATAAALHKVRQKSLTDPTMLMLRARGGPADLAYQWLRAALLLKRGAGESAIASSLGSPEWAVTREVIPAAKRWGCTNLTELIKSLAIVDRGLQSGIPAPWVACVSALLTGCRSVASR